MDTPETLPHVPGSTTSAAAAAAAAPNAGTVRARIFAWLVAHGPATDQQIQAALGLDPSTERPRRGELERDGYVFSTGRTYTPPGKRTPSTLWRSRREGDPPARPGAHRAPRVRTDAPRPAIPDDVRQVVLADAVARLRKAAARWRRQAEAREQEGLAEAAERNRSRAHGYELAAALLERPEGELPNVRAEAATCA
jgi:predicted ArsR family transcriptional regulator